MDETKIQKEAGSLGVLEASILSAHLKFFRVKSETHYHLDDEESILYNSVIRYFRDKS
jgi:hypothetical protein